jgi:hypothetical protein
MSSGVAFADLENGLGAYLANSRSKSSSGHDSGTHSSKPSSTSSTIARPRRNDQICISNEYSSFNMHMMETTCEATHLRSTRNLLSDSTASSLNQGPGQYYGAQQQPSHITGSRSATIGPDTYLRLADADADSYMTGANTRPYGNYLQGANNSVWNINAPAAYASASTGASAAAASFMSAPAYGATISSTCRPPSGQPYSSEPIHIYRASTYPAASTRGPSGMHANIGYGRSTGRHTPDTAGYNFNQSQHGTIGSRFNATAAEFSQPPNDADSWNPSHLGKHIYLHPAQQINWRHLLEPGVTADWDLIVEKIINSNDQQASIFLQQKIKNSDTAIKDDIIDSIIKRGLELMGNRFGNFLIQRVFECANNGQIMGLASHIQDHTVRLSTDAFGCHVIQKAFDCVPESFKHQMVRELLTRIRDTIVHRYACHVWQKLFELRWQGPPPMIMPTVNAALVGQWTQVAIGETGSLVVQNIFENCNDEDKRPCIDEVLNNLDYIARGQYGNWCIQHICEHGSAEVRDVAIAMILTRAADYSMDQYASKCIEKCLKVCGTEFLDRYLQQVLMRHPSDNFSPLVQSKPSPFLAS